MPDLRTHALRLLARRDYSRAELRTRLAPRAESAEQLESLLENLEASQLLSDHRYARQRVVSRSPRLGNARLRQELKASGVDEEAIAAALPEAGDEVERCRAVWSRKFGVVPGGAEERARQQRFLQYRGFSADAIRRALAGGED
ncbi:MAG TPA: recombination regulator RecX [Rhodocyclaceae bacterium]|jgi:regulatory protein|nr:recombination regulator RecX [Betaproteobacteria bacterium]HMV00371.1 recombination regulator RecX [Rhodocyclaceae bacterium]HMV22491.1 recombination regulator RecX [Rhodocyclaceae bacterium]HMW76881.1 recombination regulator RecX [Rhodocyclaceae bacterium]HNE44002.1 recombination regulator RecX [Rhodocyclaceae bacterium]